MHDLHDSSTPHCVIIPETVNMLMWAKFRFLKMIQARRKIISALGWGDATPDSLTRQISVYKSINTC